MDPVTLGMAKAYARRRNQHSGPRRVVIGTRSRTGNTRAATVAADSLSNGTDLAQTTRIRHFATADAHSIQYVYGNTAMSADGPNDITVKAADAFETGRNSGKWKPNFTTHSSPHGPTTPGRWPQQPRGIRLPPTSRSERGSAQWTQ